MRKASLMILLVLFAVPTVQADDIFPPWYWGEQNSQFWVWDTWMNAPGPMAPDSGGTVPDGAFPPGVGYASTSGLMDEFMGRFDVMEVVQDDGLLFELDNADVMQPEKQVRIQVTFHSQGGAPTAFDVVPWYNGLPGNDLCIPAVVAECLQQENGWMTCAYDFILEPNPEFESFGLKFDTYPAFVDQVVIDTWCVPEPATLSLLAIGACLPVIRRRRRG